MLGYRKRQAGSLKCPPTYRHFVAPLITQHEIGRPSTYKKFHYKATTSPNLIFKCHKNDTIKPSQRKSQYKYSRILSTLTHRLSRMVFLAGRRASHSQNIVHINKSSIAYTLFISYSSPALRCKLYRNCTNHTYLYTRIV